MLGQLDRATVAEKRVLLHVMNAKSMLELHNFLVDPPLYMPAMLRRALAATSPSRLPPAPPSAPC